MCLAERLCIFLTNLPPLQWCMLSLAMEELGSVWLSVFHAAQMAAASPAASLALCFPSPLMVGRLSFPPVVWNNRDGKFLVYFLQKKGFDQGPLLLFWSRTRSLMWFPFVSDVFWLILSNQSPFLSWLCVWLSVCFYVLWCVMHALVSSCVFSACSLCVCVSASATVCVCLAFQVCVCVCVCACACVCVYVCALPLPPLSPAGLQPFSSFVAALCFFSFFPSLLFLRWGTQCLVSYHFPITEGCRARTFDWAISFQLIPKRWERK